MGGYLFSEEQEAKGEPVVLIFDKGGSQNKTPVTDRLLKEGGNGFIWLQGKSTTSLAHKQY